MKRGYVIHVRYTLELEVVMTVTIISVHMLIGIAIYIPCNNKIHYPINEIHITL